MVEAGPALAVTSFLMSVLVRSILLASLLTRFLCNDLLMLFNHVGVGVREKRDLLQSTELPSQFGILIS